MTQFKESNQQGETFTPGSLDDLRLTTQILQNFWSEKVKAAELYQRTGELAAGTQDTKSICHVDGTTDSD